MNDTRDQFDDDEKAGHESVGSRDLPPPDSQATADNDPPRRPRLAIIVAGLLIAVAFGVGLGLLVTRALEPPGPDQVIARVGSTPITRGDFTRTYQLGDDPQQILDQLIEIELVVQAAQRDGVQVDSARIDTQVQFMRAQFQGDEQLFVQYLSESGLASEQDLRGLLGRQQLIEAMILKHAQVEQVRARHILLAADPAALDTRRAEAEQILADLKGGADFAELARSRSDDKPSGAQGGDLGWKPRGTFEAEFEEALFGGQPGAPFLVQSPAGWHIVEVQEPPQLRGIESSEALQSSGGQRAFNEGFLPWVAGLREQAQQANQINILVPAGQLVQVE